MKKDYGLSFSAAEIREKGGLAVKKPVDPEFFSAVFDSPVKVKKAVMDMEFHVGDDSIVLGGSIKAGIDLECARCGDIFTAEFSETFDEVYEDAVESIDVGGLLTESVAVMPPLKPLCAGKCKGLCQTCGVNLNRAVCCCKAEDPAAFKKSAGGNPFGVLKDLKNKGLK